MFFQLYGQISGQISGSGKLTTGTGQRIGGSSNPTTKWGRREPLCDFVKYFTKFVKVECLQHFAKNFTINENIFKLTKLYNKKIL